MQKVHITCSTQAVKNPNYLIIYSITALFEWGSPLFYETLSIIQK